MLCITSFSNINVLLYMYNICSLIGNPSVRAIHEMRSTARQMVLRAGDDTTPLPLCILYNKHTNTTQPPSVPFGSYILFYKYVNWRQGLK